MSSFYSLGILKCDFMPL